MTTPWVVQLVVGGGEMQPGGEEIQLQDPLYVFTSFVTFLIFLMLM